MIKLYVLIALLAATLFGSSPPLLKKGLSNTPPLRLSLSRLKKVVPSLVNIYFISAAILAISGGLLNIIALSKGEIIVVQPLLTFAQFVTLSLAVLWLGERLTIRDYLKVALVISGALILSISA